MKKNSSPARAGLIISGASFLFLALSPITGVAAVPPPFGFNLCFGNGAAPYFADVDPASPGLEIVVLTVDETIKEDTDMDGFRVVRADVKVKVYSRTGSLLWTSQKYSLNSPDLATAFPGQGIFPDSYFMQGFFSSTSVSALYFSGQCFGTMYGVEVGSDTYLVLILGYLAHSGDDEMSGADQSKVNIVVLNRMLEEVHVHKIRPVANRYLGAVNLSGIGNVGTGASDSLLISRYKPTGVFGKYKAKIWRYNLLNGNQQSAGSEFFVIQRIEILNQGQ